MKKFIRNVSNTIFTNAMEEHIVQKAMRLLVRKTIVIIHQMHDGEEIDVKKCISLIKKTASKQS